MACLYFASFSDVSSDLEVELHLSLSLNVQWWRSCTPAVTMMDSKKRRHGRQSPPTSPAWNLPRNPLSHSLVPLSLAYVWGRWRRWRWNNHQLTRPRTHQGTLPYSLTPTFLCLSLAIFTSSPSSILSRTQNVPLLEVINSATYPQWRQLHRQWTLNSSRPCYLLPEASIAPPASPEAWQLLHPPFRCFYFSQALKRDLLLRQQSGVHDGLEHSHTWLPDLSEVLPEWIQGFERVSKRSSPHWRERLCTLILVVSLYGLQLIGRALIVQLIEE